jgi:hypothetical protein
VQALDFDAIVPVFESGVSGKIAYVIEEAPPLAERLSAWMERNQRPTPWFASGVIGDIAAALQFAHDLDLSHGAVVPAVAWIDHEGKTKLGGFGLSTRGPEHDLRQLAALTIELLAGSQIDLAHLRNHALPIVVERIRGHATGLTERVATVIARGLEPHSGLCYGSVAEYAIALRAEIVAAASDIAAGAWEALSRRDSAMAAVLIEKVSDYDPASSELPILRVRINDAAMSSPDYATAMFVENNSLERDVPGLDLFAATLPPIVSPGSEEHDAAVRALLTPPILATSDPKTNPWYILMICVCLMILALTVLVAVTFTKF